MGNGISPIRVVAISALVVLFAHASANAQGFDPTIGVRAGGVYNDVGLTNGFNDFPHHEAAGGFGFVAGVFLLNQPDWLGFQYEAAFLRAPYEVTPTELAERLGFNDLQEFSGVNDYFLTSLFVAADIHPSGAVKLNVYAGPQLALLSSAERTVTVLDGSTTSDASELFESTVYGFSAGAAIFAEGASFDFRANLENTDVAKDVDWQPRVEFVFYQAAISLYF
jgi:hypothetical protein